MKIITESRVADKMPFTHLGYTAASYTKVGGYVIRVDEVIILFITIFGVTLFTYTFRKFLAGKQKLWDTISQNLIKFMISLVLLTTIIFMFAGATVTLFHISSRDFSDFMDGKLPKANLIGASQVFLGILLGLVIGLYFVYNENRDRYRWYGHFLARTLLGFMFGVFFMFVIFAGLFLFMLGALFRRRTVENTG